MPAQGKLCFNISVINQTIIRERVEALSKAVHDCVIYLPKWLKMKVKTKSRLAWEISLMSWVVVLQIQKHCLCIRLLYSECL